MTQPANRHPDPHQFPDYPGQQPERRPAYDPRLDQPQSLSTVSSPDPQSRRHQIHHHHLPSPSSSLSNCKSAKRVGTSIEVNAT